MSRSSNLETIKSRLYELREKIDLAEKRENDAKAETSLTQSRITVTENECQSLKNRLAKIKCECDRVKENIKESEGKFHDLDNRSRETEDDRKRLQEKEEGDYEKSRELEEKAKSVQVLKEELENQYNESVLRCRALENSLKRADARYEKSCLDCEDLLHKLEDMEISTRERETNVNSHSCKEDQHNERSSFLKDQIDKLTAFAEEKESKIKSDSLCIDRLKADKKNYTNKVLDVSEQIEKLELEME